MTTMTLPGFVVGWWREEERAKVKKHVTELLRSAGHLRWPYNIVAEQFYSLALLLWATRGQWIILGNNFYGVYPMKIM